VEQGRDSPRNPARRRPRPGRPGHRGPADQVIRGHGSSGCRMSAPQIPEPSPELAAAVQRAQMPDFPRWHEMINATGGCAQPIRLRGERLTLDADTGELIESYSTDNEPTGYLLTACGNRRASRCPACAEVYRDDTYHLIISGLSGGKEVPESVSSHPRVFLTLTAPSFGAVHSRREKAGKALPCRPRKNRPICPHGRPEGCGSRHDADAAILGQPICGDCYYYPASVLWNAHAPELWRRLTPCPAQTARSTSRHNPQPSPEGRPPLVRPRHRVPATRTNPLPLRDPPRRPGRS
jgi:hypothetical protein